MFTATKLRNSWLIPGLVLLSAGLILSPIAFRLPVPALPFQPVAQLTGIAAVRDGDGILFGKVEIRLQGVAAPELRDPTGKESKAALAALVDGRATICELDGAVASSNRPVGVCFVDGLDVGAEMIRLGFARDCPAFSTGRYDGLEQAARAAGHDLSAQYGLPTYC